MLILSFDTELYGRKAKTEEEAKEKRDFCVNSVKKITKLLKKENISATFFVLGKLLELEPRIIPLLKDFDIQSHTYSHGKVIDEQELGIHFVNEKELEEEIIKTKELIEKNFKQNIGIRIPYCFIGGIGTKDNLVKLFEKYFKFISTDLAGPRNQVNKFKDNPLQPYTVNSMLELPINGLSDTSFRKDKFREKYNLEQIKQFYLDDLHYAIENNLVYIPGFHPWCMCKIDPDLEILKAMIKLCKKTNTKIMSCKQYYETN